MTDLDLVFNEENTLALSPRVLLALLSENDVAPMRRRYSEITGRVIKARIGAMLKRAAAERGREPVPA